MPVSYHVLSLPINKYMRWSWRFSTHILLVFRAIGRYSEGTKQRLVFQNELTALQSTDSADLHT
jgi:hypothetical protein